MIFHESSVHTNNKKVCIDNCLATTHPEIASQWHPTKNGNLTPEDFTYGVGRKIWWKCIKEHEWKATIASRATGNGCPCCSSYVLFNNEKYDSLIECYYALELHKKKINFIHNIMYPDLGKRKFDFYIPEKNEYIETTSFNSKYIRWIEYKKNIEFKKQYVENVLKAKFTFIQRDLTKEEIHYVRKNLKKDTQSKHPLFDF